MPVICCHMNCMSIFDGGHNPRHILDHIDRIHIHLYTFIFIFMLSSLYIYIYLYIQTFQRCIQMRIYPWLSNMEMLNFLSMFQFDYPFIWRCDVDSLFKFWIEVHTHTCFNSVTALMVFIVSFARQFIQTKTGQYSIDNIDCQTKSAYKPSLLRIFYSIIK